MRDAFRNVGIFMDIEGVFSQASLEFIKIVMTSFNIPTVVVDWTC